MRFWLIWPCCWLPGVVSDGPGSFEDVARRVGVMDNIKARVPRGAYQGVVTCWHGNTKVKGMTWMS